MWCHQWRRTYVAAIFFFVFFTVNGDGEGEEGESNVPKGAASEFDLYTLLTDRTLHND